MVEPPEVAELVDERPEMAAALEDVLAVDDRRDAWEFEDVAVDTGRFGEIVGQGLVEETDDGYRVTDPAAVRAGLERGTTDEAAASAAAGEATNVGRDAMSGPAIDGASVREIFGRVRSLRPVGRVRSLRPGVTPGPTAALVGALALFVWVRTTVADSVFRNGDVVLMGNDPYHYRYWVETLLAESTSPLDLGRVSQVPTGEPLLLAVLWWASALLGGTREAAGIVLAWYPVVAGLVVALLLYALGARVFDDARIGVAAVVVLAVTPAHAMRTGLGFADHHAFDYAWLMATITALAWLAAGDREARSDPDDWRSLFDRRTRIGVTAFGVAVAGQTLAWNGSPVVLAPLAAYLFVRVPLDVRADLSPGRSNAPALAALGIGTVLSLAVHVALDWQAFVVVAVPGLLLVGGVALTLVGELARRRDLSGRALAGLQLVATVAGLGLLTVAFDSAVTRLESRLDTLFASRAIGETASLLDPSRTFSYELVGLVLAIALPFMVGALWRSARDDRWLVVSVYAWSFLVLSAVQLRFVGQLSPLIALFAGYGLVRTLERLELAAPTPSVARDETDDGRAGSGTVRGPEGRTDATWIDRDRLTVRSAVVVVVLVSLLVGPAALRAPDEVASPAVEDRVYESATWIAADADRRGLEDSERYVFSRWGENRIYNYFASGDSDSYGFAQSNYIEFLDSNDPAAWYETLDNTTEYVVLTAIERRPNTVFHHLWVTHGSRWPDHGYDAVSHYRAVYVTDDYRNRVYRLVPGATISGATAAGATVDAETRVEIPNDRFRYAQQATVGDDGAYDLTVPYPGEYDLTVGNETRTVSVPESAVENGENVTVGG